jgi:hypothetical protein
VGVAVEELRQPLHFGLVVGPPLLASRLGVL